MSLFAIILTIVFAFQMTMGVDVVDIIITVKTRLSIIERCVDSLIRHRPDSNMLKQRIIFVDDGSPSETLVYEEHMCNKYPAMIFCIATKSSLRGYTRAVVLGTQYGAEHDEVSKAIVLLNSDTIVTEDWLLNLYKGLMYNQNEKVKIVGPLSNAASFQSVPLTTDRKSGDWSTNPMPPGMNVDLLGWEVARISKMPGIANETNLMILNGFCFMFKRDLINAIGNFDEVNFPSGYGEEVDFSIRAEKAGFEGRVITSSYVSHLKTSSFTTSDKKSLKKSSRETLKRLYGASYLDDAQRREKTLNSLHPMRVEVDKYYKQLATQYEGLKLKGSILFVSHDLSFGGGVISYLSEAYQMRLYGVNVSVSVPSTAAGGNPLETARAMLPGIGEDMLKELIILHEGHLFPVVSEHFIAIAQTFDIVVATFCLTMNAVEIAVRSSSSSMIAYYAQDYEPWFFNSPFQPDKKVPPYYKIAMASYTADNSSAFVIAKTEWTANMIEENHQVHVNRILGSINHEIFYPDKTALSLKMKKTKVDKFKVVVVFSRTNAAENLFNTLDLVLRLAYQFPHIIEITIYGLSEVDLIISLRDLIVHRGEMPHRTLKVLGSDAVVLKSVVKERTDMADIFRGADLFIDMSWWQAYGRSGLEAMACGCVSIMPITGAATEICEDGKYCLAHDGNDEAGYYEKVVDIMSNDEKRYALIRHGIERTWKYSVEGAAASIASTLKIAYNSSEARMRYPVVEKKKTAVKWRRKYRKRTRPVT